MAEVKLTTGGAERGAMVLAAYDSDERDRVCRLLTDLAEYCWDAGLSPIETIATFAQQRANERRRPEVAPDAFVFRCQMCSYTAATGSGAAQHELSRHGGAQTCWRTIDRDNLKHLAVQGIGSTKP